MESNLCAVDLVQNFIRRGTYLISEGKWGLCVCRFFHNFLQLIAGCFRNWHVMGMYHGST